MFVSKKKYEKTKTQEQWFRERSDHWITMWKAAVIEADNKDTQIAELIGRLESMTDMKDQWLKSSEVAVNQFRSLKEEMADLISDK
jgi:hypothetical protein